PSGDEPQDTQTRLAALNGHKRATGPDSKEVIVLSKPVRDRDRIHLKFVASARASTNERDCFHLGKESCGRELVQACVQTACVTPAKLSRRGDLGPVAQAACFGDEVLHHNRWAASAWMHVRDDV